MPKEKKSAYAKATADKVKKEEVKIKTDAVEEKTAEAAEEIVPEKKKSAKSGKKAVMKKKKVAVNFDRSKNYPIAEAIKLAKENSHEKFDASVDVHFNLGIDTAKGEQQVRSTVALPHGVGKTVRIVAFVEPTKEADAKKAGADFIGNDEFIDKIKKTEKTDFDLAIAEPSVMRKLGVIAKILGTRGLMPSPKNDTVTADPIKAIAEFKKGKLSFKNDDTGNLHITIGRKSFDNAKLVENFNALLEIVRKAKPSSSKGTFIKNITVCTSMGAGVKVENA
ncbi:MAG: 50S ribosomal protein L1 [Patescibacteria group bacterium]|nr:50S ribosomal protein L1 [Patescibacteria group bacterium]